MKHLNCVSTALLALYFSQFAFAIACFILYCLIFLFQGSTRQISYWVALKHLCWTVTLLLFFILSCMLQTQCVQGAVRAKVQDQYSLHYSLVIYFRDSLSVKLKIIQLAKLAEQCVSGICLFLPPQFRACCCLLLFL